MDKTNRLLLFYRLVGESGSTYINANYITNFRSKKTGYIAAQGPLPSTIIDFWRMVWENDVSAVVMTCLLFERKRIRCARYWPDTQQRPTEIYGHFKVSIDSFAKTEDYEVSMLYLVNLKAGPNEVQKKQVSCDHFSNTDIATMYLLRLYQTKWNTLVQPENDFLNQKLNQICPKIAKFRHFFGPQNPKNILPFYG